MMSQQTSASPTRETTLTLPREIILTMNNIGGLLGGHDFTFRKGLNLMVGRNALGISSVMDAIACAMGSDDLENCVHALAKEASASLKMGNGKVHCNLLTTERGVRIEERRVLIDRPSYVCAAVVNEKHPLHELTDENVQSFLTGLSGADVKENEIRELKKAWQSLDDEIKGMRPKLEPLERAHLERAELDAARLAKFQEYKDLLEQIKRSPPTDLGEKKEKAQKIQEDMADLRRQLDAAQERRAQTASDLDNKRSLVAKKTKERNESKPIVELAGARQKKSRFGDEAYIANKRRAIYGAEVDLLERILQRLKEREEEAAREGKKVKVNEAELECPFCAPFEKVKARCNLATIPPEVRIEVYNDIAAEERQTYRVAQRQVDAACSVVDEFKPREEELEEELSNLRNDIQQLSKTLSDIEAEISAQGDVYDEQQRALSSIDRELALHLQLSDMQGALKKLDEDISAKAAEDEEFQEKSRELEEREKKATELHDSITVADAEKMRLLHAARLKFNTEATKVVKDVGFRNFVRVEVDDKFHVTVTKAEGERRFEEKLGMLSSSELAVMTILMALAAKLAYLPDIPIFVIDTITTSLDRERFIRLVEYMKEKVPYLIVVMLDPKQSESIKILHSVPS